MSREVRVLELNTPVVNLATELRAKHKFRTPDSLHLACAVVVGASHFLTGDRQLQRCGEIAVEII